MKIISHRGNNLSKYKGNSKEAILEALNTSYIDGVEFDVRITKDKKIVLIHDPIINFVSDGKGIVRNMKYEELLKYNFGSFKYPTKVVLLEDLLNSINTNKIILIEIKEETDNYKEIADIIFDMIFKYNLNIYVASFNYDLMKYFKTKYNKCGLLIGLGLNTKKLYNHFDFNIVSYNYRNKVDLKETFIWGFKDVKNNLDKYYIITDKPYLYHQ